MAIQFRELKELDYKTIQHIRTDTAFARLSSLMAAACSTTTSSAPKADLDLHLGFTLPTRLREDRGRAMIERDFHIGCLAKRASDGSVRQLSYSVLIGEDATPSRKVARKFHFDFEPISGRNSAEAKPSYHFQICGELSAHHRTAGYEEHHIGHLLPQWSQPRIPAAPMSLTLLLNWLLMEFGSDPIVIEARNSPHWQGLVRKAERAILKPYFDDGYEFFSKRANEDKSFYSRHLYEEN
ncbi:MAG: hypothetical protein E7J86_20985 [Aeromonas caviae]|nr:hypothetical protein [Aeromonas caviae]